MLPRESVFALHKMEPAHLMVATPSAPITVGNPSPLNAKRRDRALSSEKSIEGLMSMSAGLPSSLLWLLRTVLTSAASERPGTKILVGSTWKITSNMVWVRYIS